MRIHSISLLGRRESNEDEHDVILNLDGKDKTKHPINFFCIYDGHGGKDVSKYLKDKLSDYFVRKDLKYSPDKTTQAQYCKYVNKVYDHFQKKFEVMKKNYSEECGSTALLVIHYQNSKKTSQSIYVVNLGDCRAVLCNKYNISQALTKDHKPNSFEEAMRLQSIGAQVTFDGSDYRIKGLSVSRVFGDLDARPYITNEPEVFKYSLSKTDKFIIMACDGLWDVLSNQDAVDFVLGCGVDYEKYGDQHRSSKNNIAKMLAEYAIEKGSYDNVSVIVIFL